MPKKALECEMYIKETQQSQERPTPNMDLLLSKQIPILKSILYQIATWFDELVRNYKINSDLAKKVKTQDLDEIDDNVDGDNVDVEEESDDGLSDVSENVTWAAEFSASSQYLRK